MTPEAHSALSFFDFNFPENSGQLDDFLQRLPAYKQTSIGYPIATDLDHAKLAAFMDYMINNAGDPYVEAIYQQQTRPFERDVVDFFARLFRAPADNYWGYVTSGGTEGNLYGMYVGRERFPGAHCYYSAAAHYSIAKNAHILGMPAHRIPTTDRGVIDYAELERVMAEHSEHPAVIVANIGTTMAEARDDVARLRQVGDAAGQSRLHIHADAALCGSYAALLPRSYPYDFEDGADSIAVSGHKFVGSPLACGVVMTKKEYRDLVAGDPVYVGSPDTSISGSRSGLHALCLWYSLSQQRLEGLQNRLDKCLALAEYTLTSLRANGIECWRNPDALTVVFKTPHQSVVKTWQLASYDGWSHIICMPGITKQQIDECIADICASQKSVREPATISTGA